MTCDGREYDAWKGWMPHDCVGPIQANHTLINKAKYRGVKDKTKREYFEQEINFSMVCQGFHGSYGETTEFREFWQRRQAEKYGADAVRAFYRNAPLKIKLTPII